MILRTLAVSLLLLLPLSSVKAGEERPLIGINMNIPHEERTENTSFTVFSPYIDAVAAAGGIPIVIPPVLSEEHMEYYASMVDGFVFTGGADINPARYGQEQHETVRLVNTRREEFDFRFMEHALATGKPVLAVCLGAQALNVAHGGTLIQDIPDLTDSEIDHRPDQPYDQHAHPIEIEPGSLLHRLTGTTTLNVNSIHHQAVDDPGEGIIVTARSPDGIVEAIELAGHPFALGIQWHPESLMGEQPHHNIFAGFIEAARESSAALREAGFAGAE